MKKKKLSLKGTFHSFHADDDYKFTGRLVNHPTYGAQFDVHTFAKEMPGTETGLIHYLSGDLFPGIGMKTAESIVETWEQMQLKRFWMIHLCLIQSLDFQMKEKKH